jgi:hypothetical protein
MLPLSLSSYRADYIALQIFLFNNHIGLRPETDLVVPMLPSPSTCGGGSDRILLSISLSTFLGYLLTTPWPGRVATDVGRPHSLPI